MDAVGIIAIASVGFIGLTAGVVVSHLKFIRSQRAWREAGRMLGLRYASAELTRGTSLRGVLDGWPVSIAQAARGGMADDGVIKVTLDLESLGVPDLVIRARPENGGGLRTSAVVSTGDAAFDGTVALGGPASDASDASARVRERLRAVMDVGTRREWS